MPTLVKFFGLSDQNVSPVSLDLAVKAAIRLSGLTGVVYPSNNDDYLRRAADEIISAALDFCVHARRYLEVEDMRGLTVKSGRWNVLEPAKDAFNFETNMWAAINGILHSRRLVVMFVELGESQFEKVENMGVVALEVESDRRSRYHVEPFGLCHAFLTRHAQLKEMVR